MKYILKFAKFKPEFVQKSCISFMIKVGVVGHRYLTHSQLNFVRQNCLDILNKIQNLHGEVIALSAIAEGADSIFAEVAISLKIPLHIIRPFKQYSNDFSSAIQIESYNNLRHLASNETLLHFDFRSEKAYYYAMQWIVKKSEILIAAWDGKPARGIGGTGNAVKQAILNKKEWIHLDVNNQSTKCNLVKHFNLMR